MGETQRALSHFGFFGVSGVLGGGHQQLNAAISAAYLCTTRPAATGVTPFYRAAERWRHLRKCSRKEALKVRKKLA